MANAKDKFRIRYTIWVIIFGIIGSLFAISYGRQARRAGDSVSRRQLLYVEECQRKGKEEREAAARAKAADETSA